MMKTTTLLIAGILAAQLCPANELQQKYEKAYYLETAKGQAKQAAALYKTISEAEATAENKPAIKQSLLRLLHIATFRKHESTIKECHEKMLQKTDTTIQELVDVTKAGGTVYIPAGKYEGTVTLGNKITLKGENRETCILFATADRPLIHIPKRQEATLESLSLKSQMSTSERSDPPAYTLVVQDAKATVIDCDFGALGHAKRSPCAVAPLGFSEVDLQGCRFVGYEYTISYGGGAKGSVKDCTVMNSGHCGITVGKDCEVEITGNIVTGSRYHGIRCTGGMLTVKDNLIINNRNRGIYLGNNPAQGEVSNNAIVGNGTGISSFSHTEVEIENNVILGNQHAGLDTRGTCRIEVANNIFTGNKKTGFAVYEGGNERFRVGKNTFWKNGTPSIDFKLPSSTLEADPQFTNPDKGNFSVGNSKIKSAQHGLTNPEIITKLWEKYKKTTK
jgi:parallel beta-helix repeat protein